MSNTFGAHEVLDASWSLGMCGHIEWRKNFTNERFKLTHSMQGGMRLEKYDWDKPEGERWVTVKDRISDDELIEEMKREAQGHHWSMATFLGWWAGAAAGIDIGRRKEEERRYARQKHEHRLRPESSA